MAEHTASTYETLSDSQLLNVVMQLADRERQATADLIAALAELDARRLYLGHGCSSLFTYCTQVLHLSEHAAYGRIEAARAVRRFPRILERLRDGSVHLTAICLLAPHLTPDNHAALLDAARHRRKRDVEQLVARLRPQPDAATLVRKLPAPRVVPTPPPVNKPSVDMSPPAASPLPPLPSRPVVIPLAPERYRVQFTVSKETHDKLLRVQDLLRHAIPSGDLALVVDRALTVLLQQLEKAKTAITTRPRPVRSSAPRSRHVAAAVRRAVWERDGGRCAFMGPPGRCTETGFLEFHHVQPYAAGGAASVENIELRCRAHNAYESEQHFGALFVREEFDTESSSVLSERVPLCVAPLAQKAATVRLT